MQPHVIAAQASLTLHEFVSMLSPHSPHDAFPVFEGEQLLGRSRWEECSKSLPTDGEAPECAT